MEEIGLAATVAGVTNKYGKGEKQNTLHYYVGKKPTKKPTKKKLKKVSTK